ncbi:MAG: D-glycero-beta-D-manno-heptose 1,7-bisphosphate 7-phosphatase [Thermovirga sp.]|nr:D-glycero-beta-D-manno-heptose 1,7-bisphosphate 7-phosphatase [Thermovirga sp.]
MKYPAVFLDRDGTIIEEVGYLDSLDKVELLPGIPEALSALRAGGFKLFVITNQSGVARGLFDETFVHETHEFLSRKLKEFGCSVDGFYFCPHHPTEGRGRYRIQCNCRKPKPGMILQAVKEHNLDLSQCWMVGDKMSDIMAGKNVGIKTVLVLTGYGQKAMNELVEEGYLDVPIAKDMKEVVQIILESKKLK